MLLDCIHLSQDAPAVDTLTSHFLALESGVNELSLTDTK